MSKPSEIGLTHSERETPPANPSFQPTPEQKERLFKSASRLVCRHGWRAFAEALAQVCQSGTRSRNASPQAAAVWEERAEIIRHLADPIGKGQP